MEPDNPSAEAPKNPRVKSPTTEQTALVGPKETPEMSTGNNHILYVNLNGF
jgi:hypothetical protein